MKQNRKYYYNFSDERDHTLADTNEIELSKDNHLSQSMKNPYESIINTQDKEPTLPALCSIDQATPKEEFDHSPRKTRAKGNKGVSMYTAIVILCLATSLCLLFYALSISSKPRSAPQSTTQKEPLIDTVSTETDSDTASSENADGSEDTQATVLLPPTKTPASLGIDCDYTTTEQIGAMIIGFDNASADTGAKLRVGDIIVAIDDNDVTDPSSLESALKKYSFGERAEIFVMRDLQMLSFYVFLTD